MNSSIRIFNYRFTVKEFLLLFFGYMFMEPIFSWLFIPESSIIQSYEKILGFLVFGFMLYSFPKLKNTEKIYIGLFVLIMIRLVLESLFEFDTFFRQLTMFYVLFPVIFTLFIKYICRTYDLDILEFIAKFYLVTYILFMVFYGRQFSFDLGGLDLVDLGPFSGDGRIIHARSLFMMIIPFLWYLHQFIHNKKFKFLLPLLFCLVVLLVHQHRSVWACTIVSVLFYLVINLRADKGSIPKIVKLMIGSLVILLIAYFFISAIFPEVIGFFGKRFSEIFNPSNEESTGNFRVQQREVYSKLWLQRPIFGWTFDGFEMTNPLVDWWDEKTGQHFHEGFMEVLFYHGIVGLLLKYSFLIYLGIKAFSKKLTEKTIILIPFCLAGLVLSLNYVPNTVFWGHVGLCLYYLEKENEPGYEEVTEEEDAEEEDTFLAHEDFHEPVLESAR